jgi:hypothetical protein
VSARTDSYPLVASPTDRARMLGCDQVHPAHAREALAHGLLVFGLCPDTKWRLVSRIGFSKPGPRAPGIYHILFAEHNYRRDFTKDGILLVERPKGSSR